MEHKRAHFKNDFRKKIFLFDIIQKILRRREGNEKNGYT